MSLPPIKRFVIHIVRINSAIVFCLTMTRIFGSPYISQAILPDFSFGAAVGMMLNSISLFFLTILFWKNNDE